MKTHPDRIVDMVVRRILTRMGIAGVLEVPSRSTGAPTRTPLVVYVLPGGGRYVLASYGISTWVKDIRAAGRGTITVRGKTDQVIAVEVDPAERDEVIAFFRKRAPRMFQRDFDERPDPADHPAFRLETSATAPPGT